ncbi:MAG TPA: PSD1 and planctomycete cytochrome C domain-containing protein [Bryobacteraceae bacterium]|nr:PSD1 and planctomycete cytochrome C domain-containing protein [Bryobacteraceae bacterium]
MLALLPLYGQAPATLFQQTVQPLLAKHCGSCHGSAAKIKFAGLTLDTAEGIRRGSDAGAVIVAGDPAASRLMKALRGELSAPMPPAGPLPAASITLIADWIRDGAHMPAAVASDTPGRAAFDLEQRKAAHWAWQPLRTSFPAGASIDFFLQEKLRQAQLTPAQPAARETLARRAAFDLTGLPLPAGERERFLADRTRGSFERLVDRLLASPRFGERWARHWMDLVRYSESHGSEGDPDVPGAWRYRDYLIRALNADVPYDQLLREHLAGDLLAQPRIDGKTGLNESMIGTGHLRMVEHGFQPVDPWEDRVKWVDNQVDVFSKAFLGLTVSCARCHDHKFDAISQKDYYALFGIFSNCRPTQRAADDPALLTRQNAELTAMRETVRRELAAQWRQLPFRMDEKAGPEWSPQTLVKSIAGAADPAAEWGRLRERWRESTARKDGYRTLWDVRGADFAKWKGHGAGLPAEPSQPGAFSIATEGPSVATTLLPGGVYSHLISDKHPAVFTSPRFRIDSDYISVRIAGDNYAYAQVIIENYPVARGGIYQLRQAPNRRGMHWVTIKTEFWKGFTAHIEMATKDDLGFFSASDADNAARPRPKPVDNHRSWFGVQAVAAHNVKEPPAEELPAAELLFAGEAPRDADDVRERATQITREAAAAWEENRASEAQAEWLDGLLQGGLLPASLPALQAAYREREAQIPVARRTPGVLEEAGEAQALLIRGGHKNPGEIVPRRFLRALGGVDYPDAATVRLRLAEDMTRPENPLPSRVIVNRLWAKLFGKGIVSSVDNFGKLGSAPTHPELLDWLAAEFRRDGWSMKRAIRRMVLSEAYQRTGQPSEAAQRQDPANRLLQHMPVKRMEAEAIRDTMLALSGRLNEEMYGPAVPVYYVHDTGSTKGDRPKGPLDGAGRRSVYLEVRRNATNPFLEVFDFPVPASTRGERDWTNVPAQSLALLNSPFVIQQAELWAKRAGQETTDPEARRRAMFLAAAGREPDAAEQARLRAHWQELATEQKTAGEDGAWRDYAHSLLLLKEFLYIP